jgi:GNAT superfamily N-acetyltransferase
MLCLVFTSPAALVRSHGPQMMFWNRGETKSPSGPDVTFEAADTRSLPEVAAFFTDAFWLGSTTFPGIELSPTDKRQLTQSIIDDLGPRYGIQSNDERPMPGRTRKGFPSKSLFAARLIVAREPGGSIVGCAGIEAAFYEATTGQVFRSDQADRLVRTELGAMDAEAAEASSKVYADSGIGGLARGIITGQFSSSCVQPLIRKLVTCSLLANLAVAPSYRRTGLGRALCDECVLCTTSEWGIDEIALQVEEANAPATTLYRKDGYREVFRTPEATALRLQPSESNLFSSLPGPFSSLAPANEKLLKEVSSPTLTMAKKVA